MLDKGQIWILFLSIANYIRFLIALGWHLPSYKSEKMWSEKLKNRHIHLGFIIAPSKKKPNAPADFSSNETNEEVA